MTFTAAPINPSAVYWITPLGNLNPPGHTFPSDHIYFYYVNLQGVPNYNVSYPVYAVADGYISSIYAASENGGGPIQADDHHTDTFANAFVLYRLSPRSR